ncbi:TauD/TfdA dioxygenase family protein [Streptomyces syringium]|uniref:TauD/TfdA dioxygenase family protein n=1 Tax=Streptomyces syringium TaxID=76729 RepID=UPI00344AF8FE
MTPATMQVMRVAGHLGAEVQGVDLSRPMTAAVVEAIRAALEEHQVLFFRAQRLDHAQQVAFAAQFGRLLARARPQSGGELDAFPQVWTISPEADEAAWGFDHEEHYRSRQRQGIGGWHTDLSDAVNPPAASVLRADVLPSHGGDTQWTSLTAAYEGLPPELQRFVDGLQAEHSFFAAYDMNPHDERDKAILDVVGEPRAALHPVVRVLPASGRKALFINPARVRRIVNLTPAESRHLLELLFQEVTRPEYTVRWRWEVGDVAIWDNRSTAHVGVGDYAHLGQPRIMHRVTLHGEKPIGPGGFVSRALAGSTLDPCPA